MNKKTKEKIDSGLNVRLHLLTSAERNFVTG